MDNRERLALVDKVLSAASLPSGRKGDCLNAMLAYMASHTTIADYEYNDPDISVACVSMTAILVDYIHGGGTVIFKDAKEAKDGEDISDPAQP